MIEVLLAYSQETADQALRAARSLRGYPVCALQEWDEDVLVTCVRPRGHDGGVHVSPNEDAAPST